MKCGQLRSSKVKEVKDVQGWLRMAKDGQSRHEQSCEAPAIQKSKKYPFMLSCSNSDWTLVVEGMKHEVYYLKKFKLI